jgi:hypothetical protein
MESVGLQSQLANIGSYESFNRRGPAVAVFHEFTAFLLVFKIARGVEFCFSFAEFVITVANASLF